MSEQDVVLVDKKSNGKIWIFTLNRPHRLNAIGGGMMGELSKLWKEFRDDPDSRVAILTATGRAFSAGAELKEQKKLKEGSRFLLWMSDGCL